MSYKRILKLGIFSLILFLWVALPCPLCYANGLVINEIVVRDAHGGTDWIEFYVTGSNSVYLGDYKVVDDNASHTPVSLPGITLYPGEFIVIPATSEDPNDGSFYVPFGLGAGDCVTLYQGSNVVDVLDWADGDAPGGYSYGLLPDGTGAAQTLLPTPNLANKAPFPSDLVINEVLVSDSGGGIDWIELYVVGSNSVYLGDYALADDFEGRVPFPLPGVTLNPGEFFVVKASVEDPGDGSYYVPFGLGADDSITLYQGSNIMDVLDWVDGDAPNDISYGRLPDGIGKLQSLTPTPGATNKIFEVFPSDKVVEVRLEMPEESWDEIMDNPRAEEYRQGSIVYNGVRVTDVAIRPKGNSSLMSSRKDTDLGVIRCSFKVDFNYYVKGQDLAGIQKLNLNNGFSDPTLMRELISYNLMRSLGIPAPRCTFVNLYINDKLIGLYTAIEAVDDEFVESNFDQGDGDLYKGTMGSYLLWDGNDIDDYKELVLKTNEDTSDKSALITMLDELNNGGDYESVLDVHEVLRYFAVNTALVSLDSYQGSFAQNFYLYEENGIFRIIPWDYNMSFGGFSMGCDRANILEFMIDEPTSGKLIDRPLIAKLLEDPEYLEIYHGYLNELITGTFSPDTMSQVIDQTADLIRPYVYADPTKFYTEENFEQTLTDDLSTDPNAVTIAGFNRGFSNIIGLKAFVNGRVASIRDQLDGVIAASGDGSGNCPNMGGPGMWGDWAHIDTENAIESIVPSSAAIGTQGLLVTIWINQEIMDLLQGQAPSSVKIGLMEGYNIYRDDNKITALFNIANYATAGEKTVTVTFEGPEWMREFDPNVEWGDFQPPEGFAPPPWMEDIDWEDFDPAEFQPPEGWGGMPPPGGFGGMFPGGMPPGGFGGMPPGGFGDPNMMPPFGFGGGGMVFTKTGGFQFTGGSSGMYAMQNGYMMPQTGYMMPQTGYGYAPQTGYGYAAGMYGYAGQTGYGSMPQGAYGYAAPQGVYGYGAQTGSGYTPQPGYGYGAQGGYASPQGIYGYSQQSGYGYTPQAGYGYTPQGTYGYAQQSGYGYPAQTAYGYAQGLYGNSLQAGYGYAPQTGYGYAAPQGTYGYPPQGTYGFMPQSGYGYAPQGGVGFAPQPGFGFAPTSGFGLRGFLPRF